MKLLIATQNPNKLKEMKELLAGFGVDLASAMDLPDAPIVEEDGLTFEANAAKKAIELARHSGLWSLADDSGLEVDALGGAPGVHSARYAGEMAKSSANNKKLLKALEGETNRRARFRCVLALSSPAGDARVVEGVCEGSIAEAPRGRKGFGYDPLFIPDGHAQTFAEMDAALKNSISHRGRALAKARDGWGAMLARDPRSWNDAA